MAISRILRPLVCWLKSPVVAFTLSTFAFNIVAVIGAYSSNPIFVTVCGSVAITLALLLGLFAKQLGLISTWFGFFAKRLARRRTRSVDIESAEPSLSSPPESNALEATMSDVDSSSTGPSIAGTPQSSVTFLDFSGNAEEEGWANTFMEEVVSLAPTLPSRTPLLAQGVKGLDKLASFTRWRVRLKFLARQNDWRVSQECTLEGPTHMPTWICRLKVNDTWEFDGRSTQRRLAEEDAAEVAVNSLIARYAAGSSEAFESN
ncbi:hypothetical protein BD626DRAFT_204986 [Schizophyllum amplum]|uniref:DRBM domain-containing protein n=1 Tax=Schizophyllum amplum TaxID=97359 RepID=A0A550BZF6_9AGAR|nr:hypothetical protein BD626DRAFT_204986 [Auriculariopsis ampla]